MPVNIKILIPIGLTFLVLSIFIFSKVSLAQSTEQYTEYYKNQLITKGQGNQLGKQGLWEYSSFLKTNLSFEGVFLNNQKEGKWTYHIKKHVVSEIYYHQGRVDSAFSYYENGEPLYEYKALNDSTAYTKSYYENGQLHQVLPIFKHQIHGITQIYFANGQLHRKTLYKDSKIFKVINCYDQKGEEIYGGELSLGTGDFIFYHLPMDINEDSLMIMSGENYKDGLLHGEAYYIRKDGKAKERGSYEKDIKVGKWEEYDENGQFLRNREYKYSKKLSGIQFKGSSFPYLIDYSRDEYTDPAYPDGEENLYRYVAKDIKYPNAAKDRGIRGRVYVSFTVNQQGDLEDVHILRGIGGGCDEECIRVTKELPRWQPGTVYGFPVKVQYSMPIKFSLE